MSYQAYEQVREGPYPPPGYATYPPPPPPPGYDYGYSPQPPVEIVEQNQSGCPDFLKGCLATLCCCCAVEECCSICF
ncbi:hypothetical protein Scep_018275 [Stephania cephalantha]|uniref:Cysteine-rich transmembrane domain-containing protein n=1 Tax=Stephania cephalantha TaxID=152367 RepID=A0AAP0IT10_9MAGN